MRHPGTSTVLNQSPGAHILDMYQVMMALCHFWVAQTYRGPEPSGGAERQEELRHEARKREQSTFLSLTAEAAANRLVPRTAVTSTPRGPEHPRSPAGLQGTPASGPHCLPERNYDTFQKYRSDN